MRVALLALVCASCVHSATFECGDQVCPDGTTCAPVADQQFCVTQDQRDACGNGEASCELAGMPGACHDGVCLPAACGNHRLDPGESCDDGAAVPGDGCSALCQLEVCGNGVLDPVTMTSGGAVANETCDDGNARSHDGCSGCATEQPRWTPIVGAVPIARYAHAMAFEGAHGRVLMFGGLAPVAASDIALGETWEWDGTGWTTPSPVFSPSPRAYPSMAYDAARGRVVMFGGVIGGGSNAIFFTETWEWDGADWSVRQAAGPPGRERGSMAYDSKRKRTVLYGGTGGGIVVAKFKDTWEWDGTAWVASVDGPPLLAHTMAYDPVRGAIVLFGGLASGKSATWTYDGASWVDVTPLGSPPALQSPAMAFDVATQKIVLMGGQDGVAQSDRTWAWDGHAWSEISAVPRPVARFEHAIAADPVHKQLVMFGGLGPAFLPIVDTRLFTNGLWSQPTLGAPGARYGHAAALDTLRANVVVFGGIADPGNPTPNAETWLIAGDSWVPRSPSQSPPARGLHAMAYDAARGQTVLFGGFNQTLRGDTWTWDGATWAPHLVSPTPSARDQLAMAGDVARKRVVLFGGRAVGSTAQDDTWEWDGTAWMVMSPAHRPPARFGHALAYDPVRRKIVLFGGQDGSGTFRADTWEYDGVDWQPSLPAVSPLARIGAAFAWNAARERLVLFGGQNTVATTVNDAWEWDGTTWVMIPVSFAPAARLGHVLVPTTDGTGVIVFGGTSINQQGGLTPPNNEVWRLRYDGAGRNDTCRGDSDLDGDGKRGCDDPDCWASCSPLCPPGATCDPTAPRCGDGICSALESCSLCPQDCGGACPAVCGDFVCGAGEACVGDCP